MRRFLALSGADVRDISHLQRLLKKALGTPLEELVREPGVGEPQPATELRNKIVQNHHVSPREVRAPWPRVFSVVVAPGQVGATRSHKASGSVQAPLAATVKHPEYGTHATPQKR